MLLRSQMEIKDRLLKTGKKKAYLCYKLTRNWIELCSSVLRKVELMSDEMEYLAEDISK